MGTKTRLSLFFQISTRLGIYLFRTLGLARVKSTGLKRFTLIILCFSGLNATPAWSWTNDTTVNTPISTATGSDRYPQIVADGAGGAIITWYLQNGGTTTDLYVQKVNTTGTVQWTVNGVGISTSATYQKYPQIAIDGSGGAIVAWSDDRNGSDFNIYAQRVDTTGAIQWAANGVAISAASNNQGAPQIIADGSGGAIVTWQDQRSGNYDVYAQRINASGAVQWAANGIVVSASANDQYSPQIISDGSGGAIVTWYDTRNGNGDVYSQRIDASGVVQWAENGVAISAAASQKRPPQITTDGSGGAIITWRDGSWPNTDIYAQRVNAAGAVQWTTNGVAIAAATGSQYHPIIIADGFGGAIIAWGDDRNLPTAFRDIYAQRVDASGAVQWAANGVAIVIAGDPSDTSQITADGTGGAIITWHDGRNGSDFDAYAQRIGADGTVQWMVDGIAVSTATGNQESPQITADGSSGAIITWRDIRNGTDMDDIYAQRVYYNGSLSIFTVTPSAGANGFISPDTPQGVDQGSTAQFTLTPDTDYVATVGGTCGGTLDGNTYTTNAITDDCSVEATFELGHTVTPSVGSNGTISPDTPQGVPVGMTTQFTVTPDTGYTASVGGTCGGTLIGNIYTTDAITVDCTVDATFTLSSYTVNGSVDTHGSLDSTSQVIDHGSTASFTVTPETGYTTDTAVGGDCPAGSWSGSAYTTGAIVGACSVSFTHTLSSYTVGASVDAHGSLDSTSQMVNYGSTASFTVTPETGYTTDTAVGGDCPAGSWSGSAYTTGAIVGACSVSFTHTLSSYTASTSAPADQGSFTPEFQMVNHGDTTTFEVTAEEGYTIQTVTGCGGTWTGANPYTTSAITADCTVKATFTSDEDCTYFIIQAPDGKTIVICL